jgi:hypothetical protein
MVSKQDFVRIVEQARTTYQSWRKALDVLGKGDEYMDDNVVALVDVSLEFAAAAIGDNGLPAERDKFNRLGAMGHDMPLTLWWAWENDWGTGGMALAIDDSVWCVDTAAKLYDVLEYLHCEK